MNSVAMIRAGAERIDPTSTPFMMRRLANGALWNLLAAVISRGMGLLSSICVARFLGKEAFGELGIIQSTVGMFGVFAGFGLGLTATKYVAEFRDKDPAKAGRIIALSSVVALISGVAMALVLVAAAPWLARHNLNAPHLTALLQISSLLIVLSAINGSQTGGLSGFEAFGQIAKISLISGLATFPLMVAGAALGQTRGAVCALGVSMAINCCLNHAALRAEARRANINVNFTDAKQEWEVLWKFSLPAALGSIVIVPVNWICAALLVNQPNGYAEMGIFNAANQWRTAILFLPTTVCGFALPMLSNLAGSDTQNQYSKVFKYSIGLNGGVALVAACFIAAFSTLIMNSYGAGFSAGGGVLILLACSAIFMAVNQALGVAMASRGQMWRGLLCNGFWALIMIGATTLWIRTEGAFGLAKATVVAYAVQSAFLLLFRPETEFRAASSRITRIESSNA